jgi:hypothetical protein
MVNYIINNLLDNKLDFNHFKNKLGKYNINIKEYDNLLLLYRNYNSSVNNNLERECRSLIVTKEDYSIISYSCPIPIITDSKNITKFNLKNPIITRFYEGTFISLFYYNDKWNISSRKHINEG